MPRTWKGSSRLHSGVFAPAVSPGPQHDAVERAIVRDAKFGLAFVKLKSVHNLRFIRKATIMRRPSQQQRTQQSKDTIQERPLEVQSRMARWLSMTRMMLSTAIFLLSFCESLYILLTVPLRVGFFFDPWDELRFRRIWTAELTIFTSVDLLGNLLRLWLAREQLHSIWRKFTRFILRQVVPRFQPVSSAFTTFRASMIDKEGAIPSAHWSVFSTRERRMSARDALPLHRKLSVTSESSQTLQKQPYMRWSLAPIIVLLLNTFPWELCALWVDYNWLHLVGLTRYFHAFQNVVHQFNTVVLTTFRDTRAVQMLSFSTLAVIVYLVFIGIYICHVAASGYMLMAHWECGLEFEHCDKLPLPGSWVIRDRLENGTKWRKYIRTLYWACKTVTTLGQGDLVPATESETVYRILVQFLGGLWATSILTAYSFYFSHKDANMRTSISTRLQQAKKFLSARNLSGDLANNVCAYFQYMQRTRNGVEEDFILSNLPPHYQAQCSNYIKYKCFRRIPVFRNRQGAFVRTILNLLEKDFFSPKQIVLDVNDPVDMLVVASGEIHILDACMDLQGQLKFGNSYAEYALFEDYVSPNRLVAATFCELWYLPKRSFKMALKKHFSKLTRVSILAQKLTEKHKSISLDNASGTISRCNSIASMEGHARTLKLVGAGSSAMKRMMKKIVKHRVEPMLNVPSWRRPNSYFQSVWVRLECLLLVALLAEVPHHIAFQRGFGLLNDRTIGSSAATPFDAQLADFVLTLLIEIFFYVDLYFRARCFARAARSQEDNDEDDTYAQEIQQTIANDVILDKSKIFQYYMKNEKVVLDLISLLPVSLIWDFLPKDQYDPHTIHSFRLFRLLRLIRVRKLKSKLKRIMIERGLGPSSRLLIYMVIFCTTTAHISGCIFFLLADCYNFVGGLPRDSVAPGSITSMQCLEDASMYENCTWYMYDRSTFNIDAPYLRSFHWSIVLLSTVGFGDIVSFSTDECLWGALWIFFGANICYFTGSAISSVLSQWSILDSIRHEHEEVINLALMSIPNISEVTKQMVRGYYEMIWKINGSATTDTDLLDHLPRSLRCDVCCALYMKDLRQCSIFADCLNHPVLLKQICRVVTCQIILKDAMVVKEGHIATEFYVIQSGEAERLLPPMQVFGEDKLATNKRAFSLSKYRHQWQTFSSPNGIFPHEAWGEKMGVSVPNMNSFKSILKFNSLSEVGKVVARNASNFGNNVPIPISILKKCDYFGEESLSRATSDVYQLSIRAVSILQLAVIRRKDILDIYARYPYQFARILRRKKLQAYQNQEMLRTHRLNFILKPKIRKCLGVSTTLYAEHSRMNAEQTSRMHIFAPEDNFPKWWHRIIGLILVYNFYQIIFRIAFLPYPSSSTMCWLTAIDYVTDVLLYIDIYLKCGSLGYTEVGQKVMDPTAIRKRYMKGWFVHDCWSMLPIYYQGDYFYMTVSRVPRLFRSPQLVSLLDEIHIEIQHNFLRGNATLSSIFDLIKFFLIFFSTAHYIGSLYYLLGRRQLETGLVQKSWVNSDQILKQYPNNMGIHYMRAMYWCLSTFTVDCFGDILAQNFLETCFCGFTCILGWIFIGQVIGRINILMTTLDNDAKQQHDRIEDFQQYARQRNLPGHLRLRAMESLVYKSECLLELKFPEIFKGLPSALRIQLFTDMYDPFVRSVPEFQIMTRAQLDAICNALYVEIYLHGDILYEAGRMGTKLYIISKGRAEIYSPSSNIVYAALEDGMMFGDLAFFLPGVQRLSSARAVRSCKVLQLDRLKWNNLWPLPIRAKIENVLIPIVKQKYQQTARSYLSIDKNFYMKQDHHSAASDHVTKSFRSSSRSSRTGSTIITARRLPSPNPVKADNLTAADTASLPVTSKTTETIAKIRRFSGQILHRPFVGRRSLSITPSPVSPIQTSGRSYSEKSNRNFFINKAEPQEVRPSNSVTSTQKPATLNARKQSKVMSVSLPKRRSSLTIIAEILGLKSTSPTVSSDENCKPEHQKHLAAVISDQRVAKKPGIDPIYLKDTRWKLHEKRLRAIQLFQAGWEEVQNDLSYTVKAAIARRTSISILPSYYDSIDNSAKTARFCRRHSIQLTDEDLRTKLLEFRQKRREASSRTVSQMRLHLMSPGNKSSAPQSFQGISIQGTSKRAPWWPFFYLTSRYRTNIVVPVSSVTRNGNNDTDASQIWAPVPIASTLFTENSVFRQQWSIAMLCVTLYYLIMVPFRVSFLYDYLQASSNEGIVVGWYVAEYLFTDGLCVLDFVLQRSHFVYMDSGDLVTDSKAIAAHYWSHGSYVVDILSIFPLEILALMVRYSAHLRSSVLELDHHTRSVWHLIALCRLNRFLRGVHLNTLSDKLQNLLLYDLKVRWLRRDYCYPLRLGIAFALFTHWVTCLFYGVSYLAYEESRPSWLTTRGMLLFQGCKDLAEVSRVSVITAYIRSYHFSIGAITTVCYGDILPMNAIEDAVTLAVILVSVVCFGILSGGFFKYFEIELGKRAEYEEKVAQVGHFMVFHRFPSRTWQQMQVYFALSWEQSKGMHEDEMLRGLTTSVRQDIALHVHLNLLQHVKLFADCDLRIAKALIAALKRELFVRNDVIIQRGDMGRSLYIIESGMVSICLIRTVPSASEAGRKDDRTAKNDDDEEDAEEGDVSVNEWITDNSGGRGKSSTKTRESRGRPMNNDSTKTTKRRKMGKSHSRKQITQMEKQVKGQFDHFGERSLLFGTPRGATCVALCVCSLFVLTIDRFEAILQEFPSHRMKFMQTWVMNKQK